MRQRTWLFIGLLAVVLAASGCSGGGDDGLKPDPNANLTPAQRQARQDKQIADIQNNPNMSDQMKQMAIAAIKGQGHEGGGGK